VFSGMIGVTLFGIFLTPVFYYVITRFTAPEPVTPAAPGKAPVIKDEATGDRDGGRPGTADGASQGITAQPPPHPPA
jgi:hypothetical protein